MRKNVELIEQVRKLNLELIQERERLKVLERQVEERETQITTLKSYSHELVKKTQVIEGDYRVVSQIEFLKLVEKDQEIQQYAEQVKALK